MLSCVAELRNERWCRIFVCFVFRICRLLVMVMGSFRGALSSCASVLGAGGSGILLLGGWDKMIGESVFVGA